jgi:hypothetical protein
MSYFPVGSPFVPEGGEPGEAGEAFPVGSIFIAVVSTNPGTLLGYGTWSAFGSGKTLVGINAGDATMDTVEETGGSSTATITGTISQPTLSGSLANESAHTHGVTSNVTVGNHASHTHTYTQVPNHVHVQTVNTATTGGLSGYAPDTSTNTAAASGYSTQNPTGGVATATTNGPDAPLTHTVTNNAVTSAAGSAHTHGLGTVVVSTPTFTGDSISIMQPFIVVYMWKRTA